MLPDRAVLPEHPEQKYTHRRQGQHDVVPVRNVGTYEDAKPFERLIAIDQTPIGRTPRSNPATYTKIFDEVRQIFAQTNDAKRRGYNQGRFSFNVKGGRCETCRGEGQICVEMHFLLRRPLSTA